MPDYIPSSDDWKTGAERMHKAFRALGLIESETIPKRLRIPLDDVIDELRKRTAKPRLEYCTPSDLPSRHKSAGYRKIHFTPEGIVRIAAEDAFTKAAMIVGGNSSGQAEILGELHEKVEKALVALTELTRFRRPKKEDHDACLELWPARTLLLFKGGPLPDRRESRCDLIYDLRKQLGLLVPRLDELKTLTSEDLSQLKAMGRPPNIASRAFVRRMAQSWTKLTKRPPSMDPNGAFAGFVAAAWASGVPDRPAANFDRAIGAQLRSLPALGRKARKTS
jgi:hypothetical protein